jgi:hypothetical protein
MEEFDRKLKGNTKASRGDDGTACLHLHACHAMPSTPEESARPFLPSIVSALLLRHRELLFGGGCRPAHGHARGANDLFSSAAAWPCALVCCGVPRPRHGYDASSCSKGRGGGARACMHPVPSSICRHVMYVGSAEQQGDTAPILPSRLLLYAHYSLSLSLKLLSVHHASHVCVPLSFLIWRALQSECDREGGEKTRSFSCMGP